MWGIDCTDDRRLKEQGHCEVAVAKTAPLGLALLCQTQDQPLFGV